MKKMKKKGFTLVELLAVIIILTVILLIGVPTIINNINRQKEIATNKVYDLIKSAAKNYEIDYGITEKQAISINDLCERYIACPIINPSTNEEIRGYISIADGEYKFIGEVKFDWNLNGGTTSQEFQHTYMTYTKITLIDPIKPNSDFKEWVVVRGNSTINNKVLTIGDTDTEIWAMWTNWAKLTIDPNGGTTSQSLESYYRSGTNVELQRPTKAGYVFTGWTASNDNSILSGNNFTMGSTDIILTANWEKGNLISTYSCANTSYGSNYMFTYTGDCEVIDDGNNNWRIKFLTSGTFNSTESLIVDAFLVGGGGGGGKSMTTDYYDDHMQSYYIHGNGGGGGGGGYTSTESTTISVGTNYNIVIGSGGGPASNGESTSAFGYTVDGGKAGGSVSNVVGSSSYAGQPGDGGSNGGSGRYFSNGPDVLPGSDGSPGQGSTTREFGMSDGTLYAGGGAGGNGVNGYGGNKDAIPGGEGGGGASDTEGLPNTGGGGGGASPNTSGHWAGNGAVNGRAGGSGIVIIRNAR